MKRLAAATIVLAISAFTTGELAAEPKDEAWHDARISSGSATATPEMWFYTEAWRRHDDTQKAVRRNAETRGWQRRARIAARKRMGYSPSRPQTHPVPWTGTNLTGWYAAPIRVYRSYQLVPPPGYIGLTEYPTLR